LDFQELCYLQLNVKWDTAKKIQLGHWVRNIRSVRTRLRSRGIEAEEVPPGKKLRNKTLTVERIERLNSIGFVWAIVGPKVPVEERFQELVEYYEMNGHWPSQSMQGLGTWIHRQRQRYSKKEPEFMKTLAPRVRKVENVIHIYLFVCRPWNTTFFSHGISQLTVG